MGFFIPGTQYEAFTHKIINLAAPSATGQGTWALSRSYGLQYLNNFGSAADGDNISFKASLKAGTYQVSIFANKDAGYGIVKVQVDGVTVLTFDTYSAAPDSGGDNEEWVNSSDGDKTITIKVDGKNGASAGYSAVVADLQIGRKS